VLVPRSIALTGAMRMAEAETGQRSGSGEKLSGGGDPSDTALQEHTAELRAELVALARLALGPGRVSHPAAREALRDTIVSFAASLKAAGWPPERTLVALKEAIREAGEKVEKEDAGARLARDAVTWCIEAFYGGLR